MLINLSLSTLLDNIYIKKIVEKSNRKIIKFIYYLFIFTHLFIYYLFIYLF